MRTLECIRHTYEMFTYLKIAGKGMNHIIIRKLPWKNNIEKFEKRVPIIMKVQPCHIIENISWENGH